MTLKQYRQKRNFAQTEEPYGDKKKRKSKKLLSFVVQKHAASHLHYDFRLEMQGVLKSWAVPKGPSLDPQVKRLAVHVEDHPLSYGSFEGTIPKGEYGGGTVMVWDQGHWQEIESSPGYSKGDLKFMLKGKKLTGIWKLIQIKKDPKNWLLIKVKDEAARDEKKYDITQKETLSVLTERTLEEIAKEGTNKKIAKKTKAASKKQLKTTDLTHPERILYEQDNITKQDLAHYYETIQTWILPYICHRPLTLVRCPQGSEKDCFYQKHIVEKELSSDLFTINIKEKEKTRKYIYIKNLKGLLKLVQMNVLEIHLWGARVDKLEKPDQIVFDLDPGPGVSWGKVIESAWTLKEALEEFGLTSFVKTTGGKGLHIVAPIQRRYGWDPVKLFTKQFVEYMVAKNKKDFIGTATKAKREGKIYIDYLRNGRGATAVAPYSTRARPHAPVATPIAWEELSTRWHADHFNLSNLPARLARLKNDPWKDFFSVKQNMPKIEKGDYE